MSDMAGKVALVTGGASGIGRATAIAFAREGADVVVADLDADNGEKTVAAIGEAGSNGLFVRTDVSDPSSVAGLVRAAVEHFGRLDVAFNNAGIEGDQGLTADCSLENWSHTLGVNLTGVFCCMREELAVMEKAGGGAIVNTSSVAGLVGFEGSAAYVASKHGVVGLTKTAALEYATRGIRVNAVCPGVIDTEMVSRVIERDPAMRDQLIATEPVGRLGRPEEVAEVVVWLCSDRASFVTGEALAVDGGFVAR